MALRIRRGTDAERQTVVFAEGELVYTTDTKDLYVGDGETVGGISIASTSVLGQNIILNNYDITGQGNINITGSITASSFVGDGSGLTNIPGVNEIVEGSDYRINIIGADSSLIVDTENNKIIANTARINQLVYDFNNPELIIFRENNEQTDVIIKADENIPRLYFYRNSTSDISNTNVRYGQIVFGRDDLNGRVNTARISSNRDFIWMGHNSSGTIEDEDLLFIKNGDIGIGTITPEEKFDVNGSAIIRGNLSLESGSLILEAQSLNLVSNPVLGQIAYNQLSNKPSYYDGSFWFDLVGTDSITGFTLFENAISIGGGTTQQRDQFGNDSTLLTGGVFYNFTDDRFQFFQAGSWVSLPDNGSDLGQILAWNGTEWTATDPSVVSGTVQNADLLDGFSGSFYLDYNNFTNTPTIPDGLSSRAALNGSTGSISDGASANVNITGYKGYMLYKIETSAAAWVRLYVNDAARTADASRSQGQDPLPGSGVIAEVITTSAETVIVAPGVIGFNNESPVTNVVPVAVTNLSGGSADITVTLTAVKMEI